MRIAAFDIETATDVDGRDPARTRVTAAGVAVVVLGERFPCELFTVAGAERSVLAGLDAFMRAVEADVFATWNGSGFDLPMLGDRGLAAGVALPLELRPATRKGKYPPLPGHAGTYEGRIAGRPHVDIAYAYEREALRLGVEWSLKPLSRALGLAPVEVDRTAMHELDVATIVSYVGSDATVTGLLAARIDDITTWCDPFQ